MITNWNWCNSWQIHNGQIGTCWWEDIQHNWNVLDNLLGTTYFFSHFLNSFTNLIEIGVSLFLAPFDNLVELGVRLFKIGNIIHSQLQRSSCNNALNYQVGTEPLGRKSSPTICSSSELLPDDWLPSTTTLGRESCLSKPISLNKSTNEITLRSSWTRILPYISWRFDYFIMSD